MTLRGNGKVGRGWRRGAQVAHEVTTLQGGRNQEMALAAAIALHEARLRDVVVLWYICCDCSPSISYHLRALSAGTDGTDGPTDAAGGVVDVSVVSRGESCGLDAGRDRF